MNISGPLQGIVNALIFTTWVSSFIQQFNVSESQEEFHFSFSHFFIFPELSGVDFTVC
jgi:hypothetical protein